MDPVPNPPLGFVSLLGEEKGFPAGNMAVQAGTFFAQPPEEVGIPGWEGVPLLDFAQKAEEASESEVSGHGSPKSLGPPQPCG